MNANMPEGRLEELRDLFEALGPRGNNTLPTDMTIEEFDRNIDLRESLIRINSIRFLSRAKPEYKKPEFEVIQTLLNFIIICKQKNIVGGGLDLEMILLDNQLYSYMFQKLQESGEDMRQFGGPHQIEPGK